MMENYSKLEAARRLRGWTLAVASEKIGVHPRTLRRWETGKSKPYGFRIYKISAVYEMTPRDLGIEAELHEWHTFHPTHNKEEDLLLTRLIEPLMTIEDLDLHLIGLILRRKLEHHNLDYGPFQRQLHQCIKTYDKHEQALKSDYLADPVRIQALRVVASIPIMAYLEKAPQRSWLAAPSEVLTHCASAIVACWHMDLSLDLDLARFLVSGYILLLDEIFTHFQQYRQAAAELNAQAHLLRAMLSLETADTHASVSHLARALDFSQTAHYPGASADAPLSLRSFSNYGRQPISRLKHMSEALWLLKPAPLPTDFSLVQDYLQKLAPSPSPAWNISSMRDISVESTDFSLPLIPRTCPIPTLEEFSAEQEEHVFFTDPLDYAEAALHLWPALTSYELDTYAFKLDNNEESSPVPSDNLASAHKEFRHNRALSSLRLHDMDQEVATLRSVLPQALSLGNERELIEARQVYHLLQFLTPNEALSSAREVKDLLQKHD